MRTFWRELKFGLRLLLKSPGATLLAMLALGLGIGANTAMFSVADGMLAHPLPYPSLAQLVSITSVAPHRAPTSTNWVSAPNFLEWQSGAQAFSALAAYEPDQMNLAAAGGDPVMADGDKITPNFFQVTGARPAHGRDFLPEEGQPGRDHEVILSDALWRNRFAADPAILGAAIQLDTELYTVVGIMGPNRDFPQVAEFWIPLAFDGAAAVNRADHPLQEAVGRLRPGVALSAASAEMRSINDRIDAAHSLSDRGWGVNVQPLADRVVGVRTRQYLQMLLGAAGFVLLIACANVANLQFARALGRNHELAMRTALGAGRWRLVRQMLTESVWLGLGGAVVGLGFAWISIRVFLANMPAEIARYIGGWDAIRLDPAALWFTLAVALGAGLVSGLAPAWHASRPDLNAILKEGGRGTTVGRSRQRLRASLVVAQVALALILLVGAGLMVNGIRALLRGGAAYGSSTLLSMITNLPGTAQYQRPATQTAFYDRALAALGALPGVQAAATTAVPLGNDYNNSAFSIQGRPAADAGSQRSAISISISGNYFSALRIPLVAGRAFSASDGPDTRPVAIVSRHLAALYWPGQSALGQQLKFGSDASANPWLTIVGIAADAPYDFNDRDAEPVIYRDYRQFPSGTSYFVLRGAGDVNAWSLPARRAIAAIDNNQPLFDIMTLEEFIHQANMGISYVGVMMAVAGFLALILAAVGVYGVMAFLVGEREREIGIRRALGAGDRQILGLILRRGLALLALGLAIGFPIAFYLARLMASLIFGVSASDPATYLGIGALLAAMATLACYLPALAATRIDPIIALRQG